MIPWRGDSSEKEQKKTMFTNRLDWGVKEVRWRKTARKEEVPLENHENANVRHSTPYNSQREDPLEDPWAPAPLAPELPTLDPASRFASPSTWSSSGTLSCPSKASWISHLVSSQLRLRVLGLVMVVPKLAVLEWPLLTPTPVGEYGDGGDLGGDFGNDMLVLMAVGESMALSSPAFTPFALTPE